jgi:hypothetical protein
MIRTCLQTFVLLLCFGAIPWDSNRREFEAPQIATVTCRFAVDSEKRDGDLGSFDVRGTPQNPQYVVQFGSYSAAARLERHEQPWPETFDLKIIGPRDTLLWVCLVPEDCGEMLLLCGDNKKYVNYYDERGKRLEHPTDRAFRFDAEETTHAVNVRVTLPRWARSMRTLDVLYYSTFW